MTTGNIAYLALAIGVAVLFILVVGYCSLDQRRKR